MAFLREALSTFDIATAATTRCRRSRGSSTSYVMQLRALADASLAISATLTEEEILQLTADAARGITQARRSHATSSSQRADVAHAVGGVAQRRQRRGAR